MAWVSEMWMRKEHDASLHSSNTNVTAITPESDLRLPDRHFHIVTTAALPWFTGTAVNPTLRAAYLHRKAQEINNSTDQWVTLVVPWLELPQDQKQLYGEIFSTQQEQEEFIRSWLSDKAGMPDVADPETGLRILFYPARYHSGLCSIFAMGDLLHMIEEKGGPMDVCILEEPEHVNWFRAPGDGWTMKYKFVVGIVHTNYKEYASSHYSGLWTAPAISMVSSAMIRAYCHKVIKLSPVLQSYAPEKEVVSNVHGVRSEFIDEGLRRASTYHPRETESSYSPTQKTDAYFVGKLLWAKGLDIMLDLQDYYKQRTGKYFSIDIYGSGPEQEAIRRAFHGRPRRAEEGESNSSNASRKRPRSILQTTLALFGGNSPSQMKEDETKAGADTTPTSLFPMEIDFSSFETFSEKAKEHFAKLRQELPQTFAELRRQAVPAEFRGRVDHAELKDYKVFVNPSVSEVLCTTTAEALAMGKFVIIPVHPSNQFFLKFPNCLAYRDKFEFVANLRWALNHEPEPLTPELAQQFTWEAATERFMDAAAITEGEARERERSGRSKMDERIAWFHNELGKGATGDMLRKICGAGPVSHQAKYLQKQLMEGESDEGEEDEDDGLSAKFRRSSFAEALRATVGDLSLFMQ
ncbi:hypothetical protein FisN_26Lh102 [Fistulifera solaris]|uniref:Digalactosyldiacylglycerol synthase n=1 Tax=Fistulifera solaris TaxID=1519565 RepID=A0A1Z5KD36_FISSO|nr:hypothetical protein FisN_26Lh102 [Fistulifera solaris]|eukprot:GAX24032.1 hypothetical protein FisN_26Lh102 [Fistulifera solaris]